MSKQPEFWSGLQDKNQDEEVLKLAIEKEFVEHVPLRTDLENEDSASKLKATRRDFLKYLGFSLGAATVAASCEIPVKRAIPYVVKSDDIVPGIANYYASSFIDGGSVVPILVKTREGRPIKIEGNGLSEISHGGTSARAQASVLSLYDTHRYQSPMMGERGNLKKVEWSDLDASVTKALSISNRSLIVSRTINSPSDLKAISMLSEKFGNIDHVMYDGVSHAAQLDANIDTYGVRALPRYHFDKADVIVSFDADFLSTWISPVEFAGAYSEKRKIKDVHHPEMSRHIHVESRMSYTGSNADERILVKPSEMPASIAHLYNAIAKTIAAPTVNAPKINEKALARIRAVAKELSSHKGNSLVITGVNDYPSQLLVNGINEMLNNRGKTLEFKSYGNQRKGDDKSVLSALNGLTQGKYDSVIIWDSNPAFELPNSEKWQSALTKTKNVIALGYSPNDTYDFANYVAPINHFLESWGDAEPYRGHYTFVQPTIAPLFNSREAGLSMLSWAGKISSSSDNHYYDFVKSNWKNRFSGLNLEEQWVKALSDGLISLSITSNEPYIYSVPNNIRVSSPSNSELEISFYETINIGAGQHVDNPWLQELPDPIMRTVWGNYLSIPIKWNGKDSFETFKNLKSEGKGSTDIVEVTMNGATKPLPVVPQFGQMENTLAVGLGYGRKIAGRCSYVGQNINESLRFNEEGYVQYWTDQVELGSQVGEDDEFACVQYHHTYGVTAVGNDGKTYNADEKALGFQGALMDRSIMRYGTLDAMDTLIDEIKEQRSNAQHLNDQTLYPSYEDKYKEGHHWSMYVDMNACIGCGACAIACMAENNVPVVGKKEVHRHHEMTWIRIDRYYFGDAENPNVVYQPMMCQHCDNAPCENVCPVAATNHSSEGLNQMTYNRCIGTRYCANNCPYKVRRFNWLDYTTGDLFPGNENYIDEDSDIPFYADNLTRMVLNPDVTVRSRGVIEKCSFCVQRIQEGKLTAKKEDRALTDGDVKTACQTACPTGAIVFGDDNNDKSEVSKKIDSPLVYKVLEEVNTASSVNYSAKVINRSKSLEV